MKKNRVGKYLRRGWGGGGSGDGELLLLFGLGLRNRPLLPLRLPRPELLVGVGVRPPERLSLKKTLKSIRLTKECLF